MSNVQDNQVKIKQIKSIETHMKEIAQQETGLKVYHQKKATKADFDFSVKKMQDTATLGAESFKENTEYKKKRNTNIRAAKKITSKATAYTLELKDQLDALKTRDFSKLSEAELLMRLESIDFTPDMMYSDMILKNFTEYMSLLRCYDELENRKDDVDPEHLQRLRPVMSIFYERMRAFCEANRLTLDGMVLGDQSQAYVMSKERMKQWYKETEKYNKKSEEDYDPANCDLTLDELDEALEEIDVPKEEAIKEPLSMDTVKDRIRNLNKLKRAYEELKRLREDFEDDKYAKEHTPKSKEEVEKELNDFEEYTVEDFEKDVKEEKEKKKSKKKDSEEILPIDDLSKDQILEKKETDHQKLSRLKKDELEARAMYLLAKKEALYNKAVLSGDPNAPLILKSLLKTRDDVKRIRDRHVREEIRGGESQIRQSRSVNAVSRYEALSTESDRISYESRLKLMELSKTIRKKIPGGVGVKNTGAVYSRSLIKLNEILDKVDQYAFNTRYKVGYTQETENLKAAIKSINEYYREFGMEDTYVGDVNQLKVYFNNMTNGKLDTSNIPPEKHKNFANTRPVEGGAHYMGWKRNGVLTTFSHWTSKKDTPLFSHEPSVNDLKQRMVTNCYMVSATATLCELSPEYIKSMMRDNGDGTVTVRLYQDRELTDEDTQDVTRLSNLRLKKDDDFVKDSTDEGFATRKEQLIAALAKLETERRQNKKEGFNFTGMNDKTEELLRSVGGGDTKRYSVVEKLMLDLAKYMPSLREYLDHGTMGGDEIGDFDTLKKKIWDNILEFKKTDSIDEFNENHRKEVELDRADMEAVYVTVDKEVPRLFSSDLLSAGALWMQMIEKACAHLGRDRLGAGHLTGYRSLWYGDSADVIRMFTGAKPQGEKIDDDLFRKICTWKEDNIIYTTGTKSKTSGTESDHAYSILGGYEKNGVRYVRLRNPYSQGSSTYDYGKGEDKFSRNEGMNFIGGSDETYGQFDIKWEDFVKEFGDVSSCNMNGFKPEYK